MIGIVYGGESCEHDISVITALSIFNAIKNDMTACLIYQKNGNFYMGKKLAKIDTYKEFKECGLKKIYFKKGFAIFEKRKFKKCMPIDCVIMCNHGGNGENGALSGYFETIGVPYTASGVLSSGICMDKVWTKFILEKFKFPVVPYKIFRVGDKIDCIDDLNYPIIVKPARLGSSVGISYVNNREALKESMEFALQFDDKLLIEKALKDFREFNCAVIDGNGIVVSEVEEVFYKNDYLDFYDKYINSNDTGRKIPANLSQDVEQKIKQITKEIYVLLELKGVVRIDFLMDGEKLYVNEINTIPGSLANYLFKGEGMSSVDLVERLISSAKADFVRKQKLIKDFSSEVLKKFDGIKFNDLKK